MFNHIWIMSNKYYFCFADCVPAYYGLQCSKSCVAPFYGVGCQKLCSGCHISLCDVSYGCPRAAGKILLITVRFISACIAHLHYLTSKLKTRTAFQNYYNITTVFQLSYHCLVVFMPRGPDLDYKFFVCLYNNRKHKIFPCG